MKMTAANIRNIPAPDKRQDIRDDNTTGLYLRCHPTGRKTWRLRYTYHGKARVLDLGGYPALSLADARKAAITAHTELTEDIDPAGESQRQHAVRRRMPTVAEFADEYIERHAKPNKKSWKADRRNLDKDVIPFIGKMRLDEIHRRDIVAVLDRIRDRGAQMYANRVYAVVRKMFNFAVERGVLDMSPAQQIKLAKETARDAVLDDDAIRTLWSATAPYGESGVAMPMHHVTASVIRLLLLTGARNSEVCGIALDEIDLKKRLWTLPASRAKNGEAHTIPLSGLALDVVVDAMDTASDTFLFPTNSKAGHMTKYGPIQGMQRVFDHKYRPHDLRRTVGTRISAAGFNRLVVDKVLNHVDRSVGGIYDRHSYDKEKREALTTWATELAGIIGIARPDKVVRLR